MYPMEVSYGVSSSKNLIPMSSENPRHWLKRFVIGCGQFWLVLRTAEETNDLDTQRNQAGGAFRVCDGTNNKVTASSQSGLESGASVFRAKRAMRGDQSERSSFICSRQEHPSSDATPGLRKRQLPRGKNARLPCADMRSSCRRYLSPRTTSQARHGATYPACRRGLEDGS